MEAIDSDVLVLVVLKQSVLQLGQPDLKVKLAVLVELDTFGTCVCFLSIPVAEIVFAKVVKA